MDRPKEILSGNTTTIVFATIVSGVTHSQPEKVELEIERWCSFKAVCADIMRRIWSANRRGEGTCPKN